MTQEQHKKLEEVKKSYAEYIARDAGFSVPKSITVRKDDFDFLLSLLSTVEEEKKEADATIKQIADFKLKFATNGMNTDWMRENQGMKQIAREYLKSQNLLP